MPSNNKHPSKHKRAHRGGRRSSGAKRPLLEGDPLVLGDGGAVLDDRRTEASCARAVREALELARSLGKLIG